jgi:sec-independent protein translocase protein TatC
VAVLPRAEEKNMSLLEHLEELRHRLLRCAIAFAIGTIAGYFLADSANSLLVRPFEQAGLGQQKVVPEQVVRLTLGPDGALRVADPAALKLADGVAPKHWKELEIVDAETGQVLAYVGSASASGLVFLKPMDPLMIRLKTAMIIGGAFSFPILLWQLLAFVAPGLYEHERRAFAPMIAMALVLFPAGVAFAYLTLKYAIVFLAQYGFANVGFMNEPPDPFSLLVMAFPLYGLFELSLLLSRTTAPKRVANDTLEPSKV